MKHCSNHKDTTRSLLAGLCGVLFLSCAQSDSGVLFNGKDSNKWHTSGDVAVADGVLTLSGGDALAVLKSSEYRDFILSMELRTTRGGKGAVWFHTDLALSKGYSVAINNDREDAVWWKMTGSLVSVRNLTKSVVRENEWFALDIIVEGKAVTVNIDGRPAVEYIEPAKPYRLARHATAALSGGTFAIEGYGAGDIQFRKIEVTALNPQKSGRDVQAQIAEANDEQTDEIIRLHQEDFPVLDYHIHLKGGLTKEDAAQLSRKLGINYAVAPNCGIGFPITDDAGATAFLDSMRTQPFILAMQAEGREWTTTFSQSVRNQFDYVFTDALTFTDAQGRRSRIWLPEETWIEDERQYMDWIVDKICEVLREPMDIYVNPCFLPEQMQDRYDAFWTEERMNRFVDALAKSGKALEINSRYQIPNKAIILKAKAAGVKFSFGTNNGDADLGKLEYCVRMKKECGLTAQDMYKPQIKL
ncbi:MAG: DUF1080 domain-containing protein [Bacteroidales bacterium]